jgi:hypothetical protein
MATQIIPGYKDASKPRLELVNRKAVAEPLPFDSVGEILNPERENLGCVRGVVWACALQLAFVVILAALWEAFRFLR